MRYPQGESNSRLRRERAPCSPLHHGGRALGSVVPHVRRRCEHTFVKPVEREEARRLRREDGLAMRVIAERLGVAKSSVSAWTHDIPLTEEQHERLRRANPIYNQQLRGQEGRRASARAVRLAAQEEGRAHARRGDPLHLLGCMLYWARVRAPQLRGLPQHRRRAAPGVPPLPPVVWRRRRAGRAEGQLPPQQRGLRSDGLRWPRRDGLKWPRRRVGCCARLILPDGVVWCRAPVVAELSP